MIWRERERERENGARNGRTARENVPYCSTYSYCCAPIPLLLPRFPIITLSGPFIACATFFGTHTICGLALGRLQFKSVSRSAKRRGKKSMASSRREMTPPPSSPLSLSPNGGRGQKVQIQIDERPWHEDGIF